MDVIFDSYDGAYLAMGDYPKEAVSAISPSLLQFSVANRNVFFGNIREYFPKTYAALTSSALSEIYLLEIVVEDRGVSLEPIGDEGDEVKLYSWGIKSGSKIIVLEIPREDPCDQLLVDERARYFEHLPKAFTVFYEKLQGLYIKSDYASPGFDLPRSFADWQGLDSYMLDQGLSRKDVVRTLEPFKHSDLRVFVRGSLGELIVVDLNGVEKDFIVFDTSDYGNMMEISNPKAVLDEFFSEAIQGKPFSIIKKYK